MHTAVLGTLIWTLMGIIKIYSFLKTKYTKVLRQYERYPEDVSICIKMDYFKGTEWLTLILLKGQPVQEPFKESSI